MLPIKISDSLHILVVLKGYSLIHCGHDIKGAKQAEELYKYFYGSPPTYPSQIEMLINGLGDYKDLYNERLIIATSLSGMHKDVDELVSKLELTLMCD